MKIPKFSFLCISVRQSGQCLLNVNQQSDLEKFFFFKNVKKYFQTGNSTTKILNKFSSLFLVNLWLTLHFCHLRGNTYSFIHLNWRQNLQPCLMVLWWTCLRKFFFHHYQHCFISKISLLQICTYWFGYLKSFHSPYIYIFVVIR